VPVVLQIHTAGRIEPLVERLSGVLSVAPADPMAPEWIAVPSEGMRRWLHLELARHLGAAPGRTDGVAANIISGFPDSLRRAVLSAGAPDGQDRWQVEHLAWSVLAELTDPADARLAPVAEVRDGASRYARARRVADLFDRYHVHRTDMIRAWAQGDDVDGAGRPLAEHHRWQPVLWRRVRARIAAPSPPEQLRHLLDELLDGRLELPLPDRLAMFGLSVLPGGVGFLDLAEAVGARHDLHLFLVEPSPDAAVRVATGAGAPASPDSARLRAEDGTDALVEHPLLRSWGRLHRETTVLLADAEAQGMPAVDRQVEVGDPAAERTTLLGRLQDDLRLDLAPRADLVPDAHDRTLQLHAAHGAARQVEVLRDVLWHLLDDDELALTEDDIVVMTPALDQLAPVIEAVLGPSVDAHGTHGTPGLRYRIADRSLRRATPLLDAVDRLLALVAGRFDIASVLDLIALVPVRTRFGFSDDDVARIGEWAVQANVRWGLDEHQRDRAGLPASFDTNTWRAALDRLLMGIAVTDTDHLGVGDVVALPVEGGESSLAGRVAALLWNLDQLAELAAQPRTVAQWIQVLRQAVAQLLAVDRDDAWQMDSLTRVLAELEEQAAVEPATGSLPVEFIDLRRALGERLGAAPGRADFFRGGVTISSMTPLRGVPFRVVVLLGVDQPAFSVGAPDGDDLTAAAPLLGDRDRRGESRQALLEAVLAARDRLVLIREGADVRTNQSVPRAVPVAELVDAVLASVHPEHRERVATALEVSHPRQAFDESAFRSGAVLSDEPWSYDVQAYQGALARRQRDHGAQELLQRRLAPVPTPVIELAELHDFLRDPVAHFVRRRLGVRFPSAAESPSLLVPLDLTGLDRYDVGSRLFAWLLGGGQLAEWERIERRRGTLGPGSLATSSLEAVHTVASALVGAAELAGVAADAVRPVPVEVTLSDGTRVVGVVGDRLRGRPGPARLTYSSDRPGYRLGAWLDLMALVAHEPSVPWRSVSIAKHPQKAEAVTVQLDVAAPLDDAVTRRSVALQGLEVAVDCYRRGLVEPVPLFPSVSHDLWAGGNAGANWVRYQGGGDGATEFARLVYGDRDLRDLRRIARRPDDPIGPSGADADRLLCFAEHLWGTIDATSVDLVEAAP
jgi:exodeoxyribonuclease V gamma subunit